MALPMPCFGPSYERAVSLLRAMLSSTTPEEFRMRKSALGNNVDADLLSRTRAEEAGRTSGGRAPMGRSSRWPNNAAGRRQASRREARAPAQGVPNAREENVREEAAEEVVAGAEGAQEGRDLMEELPQREEEAAEEAANDVQDSGDMKEAGDMDEEEQEAKEDEGAEEEQTLALALGKRTKALGALMQALTQGIKVGEKLAADDHDQGSEDTKEAGETGDEEQKAEEKDGEGKGQAALTTTAGNDGGGGARSFSSPPVDRTHHSPRGKRRMSDEKEREEETRRMRLELETAEEQYDNSEPKGVWTGTEEEWTEVSRLREEELMRLLALRRRYREHDPQSYQQIHERKKRELPRKGLGLAKGDGH